MSRRSAKLIRLFLVDACGANLECFTHRVKSRHNFTVTGSFRSVTDIEKNAKTLAADVILVNQQAPGGPIIFKAHQIKTCVADSRIIVFSPVENPNFVECAMRNGADGFIFMSQKFQEVCRAIVRVSQGEQYLPPTIADKIRSRLKRVSTKTGWHTLTHRQIQVMKLMAEGLSVDEISRKLCISAGTVSRHRYRLMKKVSASTETRLVRLAVTAGVVT